ncbi:BA75_01729T0 [Komagataella pastoris]|uniref:BA75_01729T0 n=1 Tax=Komagataella pastoris TaxID=4922 RepID=A0A1B2J664_PICPA|nr:BA75_01729T0 [Komagataella pastoris]
MLQRFIRPIRRLPRTANLQSVRYNSTLNEEYLDTKNLPMRWEKMEKEAQEEIIDHLADLQDESWTKLSPDNKKACYYLAYGEWGPRNKQTMTVPEVVFKLITSGILFIVLGVTAVNYAIDKEKKEQLESSGNPSAA